MIDGPEFEEAWALLQAAMPDLELPECTVELYRAATRTLPTGSFVAGVLAPISSPAYNNRRLPTIHELREECQAKAGPKARPYLNGVPLSAVLEGITGAVSHPPTREEAAELVDHIAARAASARLLPGPGNTGHSALMRQSKLRAVPSPRLSDAEWEERRRRLLEQATQLSEGEVG